MQTSKLYITINTQGLYGMHMAIRKVVSKQSYAEKCAYVGHYMHESTEI